MYVQWKLGVGIHSNQTDLRVLPPDQLRVRRCALIRLSFLRVRQWREWNIAQMNDKPGSERRRDITHTLRGTLDQGILDKMFPFTAAAGNTVYVTGGMVHSAKMGDTGADQLDVFWPVRPDYIERAQKQQALFSQVVVEHVKPQKLAEGFTFNEGPTWLQGKLYDEIGPYSVVLRSIRWRLRKRFALDNYDRILQRADSGNGYADDIFRFQRKRVFGNDPRACQQHCTVRKFLRTEKIVCKLTEAALDLVDSNLAIEDASAAAANIQMNRPLPGVGLGWSHHNPWTNSTGGLVDFCLREIKQILAL